MGKTLIIFSRSESYENSEPLTTQFKQERLHIIHCCLILNTCYTHLDLLNNTLLPKSLSWNQVSCKDPQQEFSRDPHGGISFEFSYIGILELLLWAALRHTLAFYISLSLVFNQGEKLIKIKETQISFSVIN